MKPGRAIQLLEKAAAPRLGARDAESVARNLRARAHLATQRGRHGLAERLMRATGTVKERSVSPLESLFSKKPLPVKSLTQADLGRMHKVTNKFWKLNRLLEKQAQLAELRKGLKTKIIAALMAAAASGGRGGRATVPPSISQPRPTTHIAEILKTTKT